MLVKVNAAKDHHSAQILESFRDANGQPRQRNLMTLDCIGENGDPIDRLLQSLLKASGLSGNSTAAPQVRFESALSTSLELANFNSRELWK